jgi:hypothetical protein
VAMDKVKASLTQLQFVILDGMADDYEDVEQLYLFANRDFAEEKHARIEYPHKVLRDQYPLREIIDEIAWMLREGYVEAKYSNDEEFAPLKPLYFAALHHYWFGPTEKGKRAWKAYPEDEPLNRSERES